MGTLSEALEAMRELGPQEGVGRFAASLDPQWIENALEATGKASVRRRKLPAEQVIWLVLGMALFADRSIEAVVDHLDLVLGGGETLASSNITKARYRIGSEPLRWLFDKVAQRWSSTPGLGGYRDLSLWGVDGTHLRVPDSDENFEHFGKPGGRAGSNDAGYPQTRLVALMNLSNRLLSGAAIGPWSKSEHTLAAELWERIPDSSLTIMDRGFMNFEKLVELSTRGTARHFMIRAKVNTRYEVIRELPDGSALAYLHPRPLAEHSDPAIGGPLLVRIIAYEHPGGDPSRIMTTLVDPVKYPADELIELYHDRWELEIGFDEIKTHMLERKESLRSQKPDGVYQEIWGQLLVYNLVRREMLLVAEASNLPPKRISFVSSLLWIRNFWVIAWRTSPGNVPRQLSELRSNLSILIVPERRHERRYPRHVKIKMSSYPRNRGKRKHDDVAGGGGGAGVSEDTAARDPKHS